MINNFPSSGLLDFYDLVLNKIHEKQLIGGVNVQQAMIPFRKSMTALNNAKTDPEVYKNLAKDTGLIQEYYEDMKFYNKITYSGMILIIGIIILILVFLNYRKKHTKKSSSALKTLDIDKNTALATAKISEYSGESRSKKKR